MEAEIALIDKVELRITVASSDTKFEQCLGTFLAPLLLKLASPHNAVRSKVLKFVAHLMVRINSCANVKLPITKLLEQIKSGAPDFYQVKLYSYLFVSKGLERETDPEANVRLIPLVVECLEEELKSSGANYNAVLARGFNILLKLINKLDEKTWKQFDTVFPDIYRNTGHFTSNFLHLDKDVWKFIFKIFCKLYLLLPGPQDLPESYYCPGLTNKEVRFFSYDAGMAITYQFLSAVKAKVLHLLALLDLNEPVIKENGHCYLLLLFASVDSSSNINGMATNLLRKVDINKTLLDNVLQPTIEYFLGTSEKKPVSTKVQETIISSVFLKSCKILTVDPKTLKEISLQGLASSNAKFRKMSLMFTQYVAVKSVLSTYNKEMAATIKNAIMSDGWPRMQTSNIPSVKLSAAFQNRKLQYETLSDLLANEQSLLLSEDLDYLVFLFNSLKGEDPDNVSVVQDVVSKLINSFVRFYMESQQQKATLGNKLKVFFRDFLTRDFNEDKDGDTHMSNSSAIYSCRYLALKFINALFDYNDVEARFLNVYGSLKTNRYDVLETSSKGLNPYWFSINKSSFADDTKTTKELLGLNQITVEFPSFDKLVLQFQKEFDYFSKYRSSCILPDILLTAFQYLLKVLVMESIKGKTTVITIDSDWDFRVLKAIELDEKVRSLTITHLHALGGQDWFLWYLQTICECYLSTSIFHSIAQLGTRNNSYVYDNIICYGETFNSIVSLASEKVLSQIATEKTLTRLVDIVVENITNKTFYARLIQEESVTVVARTMGVLTASCHDTACVKDIITRLSAQDSENSDFTVSRLDIVSNIIGRLALTGKVWNVIDELYFSEFLAGFREALTCSFDSKNWKHYETLLAGLNELAKYGMLKNKNIKDMKDLVEVRVKKCDEKSVVSWSYLSLVSSDNYIETVYKTHTSKQTEYLFSSGEALSVLAAGWNSKVLYKTLDIQGYSVQSLENLTNQVDNVILVLSMLLKGCAESKPSLRKACCIWLLSLVQYCGHLEPVYSRAKEINVAFMRFLADNDDLVQESASTGLSLIYEMGDSDLKESLVKGLMKSFTDSSTKWTAGTVDENTELFEPGVLNTPDGSISTYKDILNLASDVGDPSLVYKFMSLTKSSALWTSRKGVAFGLGNIMSKSSLDKLLRDNDDLTKRLVVKLYRYKFDPNENVARSMADIWNILIPNGSKVVEQNFDLILNELLSSISNREWRVREASTTALVDLLQTIKLDKYEDRLEDVWTLAFRSMDDIKESVRDSGTKLVKFLANSLIRSVETAGQKNYQKLLGKLIPFLTGTKGILSSVEEVRSYSLSIILKLCKDAGNVLKPFIPGLVEELLVLMSTLEPQIVNYLALNADKYNMTAADIDAKRLTGVGHLPMMEAIERMLDLLSDDIMKEFIAKLNTAAKKSVGLPSKVAASKVIVTLVVKHLPLLSESHCALLLKTCMNQLNDRNETVAIAYANAAGYLCRVCKLSLVLRYGKHLQDLYFEYKSEQDRKIVAMGVDSIAKHSTDKFNSVSSFFLPFAFVCQYDDNKQISEIFKNVWIENTGGKSAVRLYINEISTIVATHLQSQHYSIRQICAKAIASACTLMSSNSLDGNISGLNDDMVILLFDILLDANKGRSWKGKEAVLDALVTFAENFKASVVEQLDLYKKIESTLLTQAKGRNKQYQKQAITSLGKFALIFPAEKIYQEELAVVKPFLQDSFYEQSDTDSEDSLSEKIKTDTKQYSKSSAINIQREANNIQLLETLARSFSLANRNYVPLDLLEYLFTEAFAGLFTLAHVISTWRSKIAICEDTNIILEHIIKNNLNSSVSSKVDVPEVYLRALYETLRDHCLSDNEIENIRVQAVRSIGKILKVLDPASSLKNEICTQLEKMSVTDPSTIVRTEIQSVQC